MFLTLEDETGICNGIIWPDNLERFRSAIMGGRILELAGRLQREGDIIHLIAHRVTDRSEWLNLLSEQGHSLASLARADEVKRPVPPGSRQPAARHPRNVRVIPKSRDFH